VKGKLVPRLHLVARGDRRVVADARLREPAEPVLRVEPRSHDFGASHLNEPDDTSFSVTNVGTGVLSGGVSFLDGASQDFQIVSGASYADLAPGGPAHGVTVRFLPTTAGAKTEQILFDVSGGRVGAQIVTLRGVGGVGTLSVEPAGPIEFPDTAVGGEAALDVTVRNTGDGPLEGRATLTGSAEFELAKSNSGPAQTSIDYDLAPGEALDFVVRFRPATPGTKDGTLQLTGGGGASVALSGQTP
jgi:hypothetical protein